jgi:hypothetical protein
MAKVFYKQLQFCVKLSLDELLCNFGFLFINHQKITICYTVHTNFPIYFQKCDTYLHLETIKVLSFSSYQKLLETTFIFNFNPVCHAQHFRQPLPPPPPCLVGPNIQKAMQKSPQDTVTAFTETEYFPPFICFSGGGGVVARNTKPRFKGSIKRAYSVYNVQLGPFK